MSPALIEEDISSNVPWHVNDDCIIVVDLRKLEDRENITYGCWSWKNAKFYDVSGNENGPFKKCNDKKEYRVAKRHYKCNDHNDLDKYIISRCKPNIQATGPNKNNFKEAEDLVIVQYELYNKAKHIPPSEKSRTFPSTKKELKRKLDEGKTTKRATHEVLKEKGGIEKNTCGAEVPTINQVYEISIKRSKLPQDLFKTLIDKQQKDGFTGDNIVQRIQTNPFLYDIILFNDRFINNLANFCCTNNPSYKSPLSWDFMFDLGKNPSYYALVLTYRNTTFLSKKLPTTKSPGMLGPILICHKKDERSVKLLCDTLLDHCPGSGPNLQVLGADGENSILNQACDAFPFTMLLLCIWH